MTIYHCDLSLLPAGCPGPLCLSDRLVLWRSLSLAGRLPGISVSPTACYSDFFVDLTAALPAELTVLVWYSCSHHLVILTVSPCVWCYVQLSAGPQISQALEEAERLLAQIQARDFGAAGRQVADELASAIGTQRGVTLSWPTVRRAGGGVRSTAIELLLQFILLDTPCN